MWLVICIFLSLYSIEGKENYFYQLRIDLKDSVEFSVKQKTEDELVIQLPRYSIMDLEQIKKIDEHIVKQIIIDNNHDKITITLSLRFPKYEFFTYYVDYPPRLLIDIFTKKYKNNYNFFTKQKKINPKETVSSLALPPSAATKITGGKPKTYQFMIGQIEQHTSKDKIFLEELKRIPSGRGSYWRERPYSIYPLNVNLLYKGRFIPSKNPVVNRLLKSANHLFEFGHELQSQYVYGQVFQLEHDSIFINQKHLWQLAEVYFADNNQNLAKGLYQKLLKNFPNSFLALAAEIRLFDCKRLNKEHVNGNAPNFSRKIVESKHSYIQALALIRNLDDKLQDETAFFKKSQINKNIENLLEHMFDKKTRFLLYTIFATSYLTEKQPETILKNTLKYLKEYNNYEHMEIKKVFIKKFSEKYKNIVELNYNQKKFSEIAYWQQQFKPYFSAISFPQKVYFYLGLAFRDIKIHDQANKYFIQSAHYSRGYPREKFQSLYYQYISVFSLKNHKKIINLQDNKNLVKIETQAIEIWKTLSSSQQRESLEDLANEIEKLVVVENDRNLSLKLLSQIIQQNSRFRKSQESAKIISLNLNEQKIISILIKIYEDKNDPKKVEFFLETLLTFPVKREHPSYRLLRRYASNYAKQARYEKAANMYEQLAEKVDDYRSQAENHYLAGLLFYKAGLNKRALQRFQNSADIQVTNPFSQLSRQRLKNM